MSSTPDFSSTVDPSAFQVQGEAGLRSDAAAVQKNTDAINFDWSGVNALVGKLAGQAAGYRQQATTGQGLTAGQEAALGSNQALGASGPLTPALIGRMLMRGQVNAGAQGEQIAEAQQNQAFGQAAKAAQDAQTIANQHMRMMSMQTALDSRKHQIDQSVKSALNGLDLGKQQLQNFYTSTLNSAKNARDVAALTDAKNAFNNTMGYVQMGLGALSTGAAAGAQALNTDPTYGGAQYASPEDQARAAVYNQGGNPDVPSGTFDWLNARTPVDSTAGAGDLPPSGAA